LPRPLQNETVSLWHDWVHDGCTNSSGCSGIWAGAPSAGRTN